MHAHTLLAVTGLISAVAAVPMAQQHHQHHHRRDYVWETVTQEVVQTIPVTKTIWLEPGESVPTEKSQAVAPAAWDPPAASSPVPYKWTHSSYVPPVPSTSSEPVPSPTASSSSYVAPPPPPPPTSTSTPAPPPTSTYTPPPPPTSTYTPPPPPTSTYTPPPPPTSTYTPPPPPTSTYTPPPPPTSTYVPPPTTSSSVYTPPAVPSSSAAPAPAPSGGSGGNGITSGPAAAGTYYTGDLTYFTPGLGACGISNTETDHIVAIAESTFDAYTPASGNPNLNPLCGTYVTITGADGNPFQAMITDRCTGCTEDDLDLTPTLFSIVVPDGNGRVHGMKWCFS